MHINNVEKYELEDPNKLKALVLHILKKRSFCLKTEIVKLCFLVDYYTSLESKDHKNFSTVYYKKYYYGPYSDAFEITLNEMVDNELTLEKIVNGTTKFIYKLNINYTPDTSLIINDKKIKNMVNKVLKETKDKTLSQIKQMVYELNCVKETSFSKNIKLVG